MDPTTAMITTIVSICIVLFGILAVLGALYGMLVWYPRYRQKQIDALKPSGRQGEATIIRLPDHKLGPAPGRSSVYTMVPIGLQIRVSGIKPMRWTKFSRFQPVCSAD